MLGRAVRSPVMQTPLAGHAILIGASTSSTRPPVRGLKAGPLRPSGRGSHGDVTNLFTAGQSDAIVLPSLVGDRSAASDRDVIEPSQRPDKPGRRLVCDRVEFDGDDDSPRMAKAKASSTRRCPPDRVRIHRRRASGSRGIPVVVGMRGRAPADRGYRPRVPTQRNEPRRDPQWAPTAVASAPPSSLNVGAAAATSSGVALRDTATDVHLSAPGHRGRCSGGGHPRLNRRPESA